jgi:hypothetical protein
MDEPVPNYNPWNDSLPDRGPIYAETNLARLIVEPWNASSAFLFVLIVVYWLFKLRGRYGDYPFLIVAQVILLVGGVGGTIYHALRRHQVFFWMDVVPIVLLVVAGSIYLWIHLRPRWWQIASLLFIGLLAQLSFLFIAEKHIAIVMHYLLLAIFILVPLVIQLIRTRFRHGRLIALALVCFGWALLFRFLDALRPPLLPMGTHWLWHSFGAITTAILAEFFYRVESEPV